MENGHLALDLQIPLFSKLFRVTADEIKKIRFKVATISSTFDQGISKGKENCTLVTFTHINIGELLQELDERLNR